MGSKILAPSMRSDGLVTNKSTKKKDRLKKILEIKKNLTRKESSE